jgi:hypothetical protein
MNSTRVELIIEDWDCCHYRAISNTRGGEHLVLMRGTSKSERRKGWVWLFEEVPRRGTGYSGRYREAEEQISHTAAVTRRP